MRILDLPYICHELTEHSPQLTLRLLKATPHVHVDEDLLTLEHLGSKKVLQSLNPWLVRHVTNNVDDPGRFITVTIYADNARMLSHVEAVRRKFDFGWVRRACFYDSTRCLRFLLSLKKYSPTRCFIKALDYPKSPRVTKVLLQLNVVNKNWGLLEAAKRDDAEAVDLCLWYGAMDEDEALRVAVEHDSEAVIEYLRELGAVY
jgi:hypothetical protein